MHITPNCICRVLHVERNHPQPPPPKKKRKTNERDSGKVASFHRNGIYLSKQLQKTTPTSHGQLLKVPHAPNVPCCHAAGGNATFFVLLPIKELFGIDAGTLLWL